VESPFLSISQETDRELFDDSIGLRSKPSTLTAVCLQSGNQKIGTTRLTSASQYTSK